MTSGQEKNWQKSVLSAEQEGEYKFERITVISVSRRARQVNFYRQKAA